MMYNNSVEMLIENMKTCSARKNAPYTSPHFDEVGN